MKRLSIFTCIFILFDQLIKIIISNNLIEYEYVDIIENVLTITHVHNTGGAFSILSDNVWLLIGISLIALVFIYFYVLKKIEYTKINIFIYSLLIGGIIGNLIDRVVHEYVIDYISVNIFGYHFPVFNLADIGIVISVILLFIITFWEELCKKSKLKKK